MSKSYHNTIPIFCSEKELLKFIRRIKTDSLRPGEPKNPDNSLLFLFYQAFATTEQVAIMRTKYANGISWGEIKDMLFETINKEIGESRKIYDELMRNPSELERALQAGANCARQISIPFLNKIKKLVGIGK